VTGVSRAQAGGSISAWEGPINEKYNCKKKQCRGNRGGFGGVGLLRERVVVEIKP